MSPMQCGEMTVSSSAPSRSQDQPGMSTSTRAALVARDEASAPLQVGAEAPAWVVCLYTTRATALLSLPCLQVSAGGGPPCRERTPLGPEGQPQPELDGGSKVGPGCSYSASPTNGMKDSQDDARSLRDGKQPRLLRRGGGPLQQSPGLKTASLIGVASFSCDGPNSEEPGSTRLPRPSCVASMWWTDAAPSSEETSELHTEERN